MYLRISIYRKTDERVDERTYGPRMHLKRDLAFFRSGNVAQKKIKIKKKIKIIKSEVDLKRVLGSSGTDGSQTKWRGQIVSSIGLWTNRQMSR